MTTNECTSLNDVIRGFDDPASIIYFLYGNCIGIQLNTDGFEPLKTVLESSPNFNIFKYFMHICYVIVSQTFQKHISDFIIYRRTSLFAVLLFAVSTIRGPENRRKPQIARENFQPKLMVLIFADSKFIRNVTPGNSEGNL